MTTEKEKMAKKVDDNIAKCQSCYDDLEQQAEAAGKAGDIEKYHKLHIQALNCRSELEYWTAYKARNPMLWQPAPEPEKPPLGSLSAKQIRLWLLDNGKLADVDNVIAVLESPLRERAQIEWQYGNYFKRDSQFIKDIAAALGWTDEWLDTEWAKAAAIE